MSDGPIGIVVIKGSVRPGNYTSMAAALVMDELQKNPKVSAEIVDPREMHLPLPGLDDSQDSARLKEIVSRATGVIFATPEYHGTFSSVTKLVIENLGFPSVLSGKPVALLGVAAGSIGAIKSLEALRSVLSHIGSLVLPLPISVANVQRVFDKDGRCREPDVERLIRTVPLNLLSYIDRHICPRLTLERILREGLAKLPEDVVVG